jgi:hypothetical protein
MITENDDRSIAAFEICATSPDEEFTSQFFTEDFTAISGEGHSAMRKTDMNSSSRGACVSAANITKEKKRRTKMTSGSSCSFIRGTSQIIKGYTPSNQALKSQK